MQTILSIFKKKEHDDEYVFTEEDFVFKHCFKRYYIRKTKGAVELWCRHTEIEGVNFYLGKVVGNNIILSKSFYTYPYDVQKGGSRLARIYLHNDDRW